VAEKPIITEQQLARVIRALDTDDRRLAIWLALTTGLDRGVIRELRPDQIDREAGVIRLRRPKTGKLLAIPIHRSLLAQVLARCDRTPPSRPLLAGVSRQSRSDDWWARATAAAGVPELQIRHLRAVAASRLQRLGQATLPDARELLGHASVETTAAHYHAPAPQVRQALDRLPLPGFPARARATRPRLVPGRRPASGSA
jgi:integrase